MEEYFKQNSVKPMIYLQSVGSAGVSLCICWKNIFCATMSKQIWCLITPY